MSDLHSRHVATDRLRTHVTTAGSDTSPVVLLIHGNASSNVFFDRVQMALSERWFTVAPDLRGYGQTETKPVDATRGMSDFADDLLALLRAPELGIGDRPVHAIGWSAGANAALQLAIDHPGTLASLVLLNPGSPYGFGGTKGLEGEPCYPDFAGSGGGTANPQFVELLAAGHRGADSPVHPRNVMNSFYWKPSFKLDPDREEKYLTGMLDTVVSPENYPGDLTTSDNWPGIAPGVTGMNNALSPKYLRQQRIVELERKIPILWIRGADDQIVSDHSFFDFGMLGQLGMVPGWPGDDVFPPQPMVGQMRAVLEAYRERGGRFTEAVLEDCGHGPHIEREADVLALIQDWLSE